MLSDNIRSYRKKNNLSQEELAEKLGVSRQSVSFWETGQTQPTIDNIIALSKIFNISSDILLGNTEGTGVPQDEVPKDKKPKKGGKLIALIVFLVVLAVILCALILVSVLGGGKKPDKADEPITTTEPVGRETTAGDVTDGKETTASGETSDVGADTTEKVTAVTTTKENDTTAPPEEPFDLFEYCKEFAIEIGELRGDYTIYQQPSAKYGGYDGEYFSISYWADSDMVEFCLHCPLSETYSHNFYLRMRGGFNGKYEYSSSKYFRDTGDSLRFATGYIDPAVFSTSYPIGCDYYDGSTDGQDQFMEDTRVGICDLIYCLKNFVRVEKMECDFSDFEFLNF